MVTTENQQPQPMPPGQGRVSFWQWLREEFIDHLIPWGPNFWRQRPGLRALGIGLAVTVTVAWILGATGHLRPAVVIAWWTGWSAYELLCRSRCKPWVKEGPWWGRRRRPATTFDLVAYVATKNLLIGVVLFLVLRALDLLPFR